MRSTSSFVGTAGARFSIALTLVLISLLPILPGRGEIIWPVSVAQAQGSCTGSATEKSCTNSTSLTLPGTGTGLNNPGAKASLYPSPIAVSGMTGQISGLSITLTGLNHALDRDLDMLLVGPTGANILFWSDAGSNSAVNGNFTLSDTGATDLPTSTLVSGTTYRPRNNYSAFFDGVNDVFPPDAPTPSTFTSFAQAFNNTNPNGTWKLYIIDDAAGEVGTLSGGWTLAIQTGTPAVPTQVNLGSTANPSQSGQSVTITATVIRTDTSGPVTQGAVAFRDGATPVSGPTTVNASGQASYTAPSLSAGAHTITATYVDSTDAFTSDDATLVQFVDTATTVVSGAYCNTGNIDVPDPAVGSAGGVARPYPSRLTVSGVSGSITRATVQLKGISHGLPDDFDVMLASPDGSRNLVLMSDVGGNNGTISAPVNLTFDDSAAGQIPDTGPLVTGTYRPSARDGGGTDAFPAPAPSASTDTALNAFNGITPNGTWRLYVVDDSGGESGDITGGWCMTFITTNDAATATTVTTSQPDYAISGSPVSYTASVTSGGNPVTTGTVSFEVSGNSVGTPVSLNASGQAVYTTSSLTVGNHLIQATYNGSPGQFNLSSDTVDQVVDRATTTVSGESCNVGNIDILSTFATPTKSSPYPSHITISGMTGTVGSVTLKLNDLTHTRPREIDMLLVAPDGTSNLVVMSDVGGTTNTAGVTLTLSDAAAGALPGSGGLTSGTFRPTNLDGDGTETYAAPAPTPSGHATFAAAFGGVNPNGTWRLYLVDDTSGDTGNMTGGWCLAITALNTAPVLSDTAVTLTSVAEDAAAPTSAAVNPSSTLISAIVDLTGGGGLNNVTDNDTGATTGIAVTNASTTNGAWYFSTNGGTAWSPLGAVSDASARLLAADANTRLYFQPAAEFSGSIPSALTFRAWDRTTGSNGDTADTQVNGGSTAFSTATDTASIAVTAVGDSPFVTSATTLEDTQTTSGLVVTVNPADGPEITHFRISAIINGSVFKQNGTPILNGDFVTLVEGGEGLKFTPAANLYSPSTAFGFSVQAGTDGAGGGLGSPTTATITVSPVADTPSVTSATTSEGTQTVNGLVVSRNAADGPEVTHFQVSAITNGTLYLFDGGTQIQNGDFLTFEQAVDGLKFTPTAGFAGNGSFGVQAATSATAGGLGGGVATATITITGIAGTPTITNATAMEDEQTTGGLVVTRNAADGAEVTHIKVTGIANGILYKQNGIDEIQVNDFITIDEAGSGLKFRPAFNLFSPVHSFSVSVRASTSASDAGLGGGTATASITVSPVADAPSVTNASTAEDSQSTGGLVITRNAADGPEVTHVKITGITNGTLYQNNGTTQIQDGSFIALDDPGVSAGLRFTPTANFSGNGSFTVQAATSAADASLGGGTATATITVGAAPDAPTASNLTQTKGYTEGVVSVALDDIVVADSDPGETITATLTLSPTSTGSLTASSGNGEMYTPGSGVWIVTGPIVQVNAALASVAFQPTPTNVLPSTIVTRVRDAANTGPADGTIALTASPLNRAPTNIVLGSSTVQENSPNGTVVGTLTTTDPDPSDTHTYTMVDGAGGRFGINGAQVRVANSSLINFEAAQVHQIVVRTTDSGNLSIERTFSITVTNAVEASGVADDTYTTGVGAPLTVSAPGVLANDTDPNGRSLTAISPSNPSNGSVQLNSNGSFTYTPAAGFVGTATFTYRATNGDEQSNLATVSIRVLPALSIADTETNEGSSGHRAVPITVTLSHPSSQSVTVAVETADGRAVSGRSSGNDYQSLSTTVTFNPGQTSKTVDVAVLGDTTDEANETFVVKLSRPNNAVLARDQATVTILDDDGAADACTPRPNVQPRVRQTGDGTLEVTIADAVRQGPSNGGLQLVQIHNDGNTMIDLPPGMAAGAANGATGLTGNVDVKPANPNQDLVFIIRRRAPGPFTVNLVIFDSCGEWRTFVGGGTGVR